MYKCARLNCSLSCPLAPNGNRIPARIISQADGSFKVEWTPTSTGKVDVLLAGNFKEGLNPCQSPVISWYIVKFFNKQMSI